jgi:hypothetical protein
MMTGQADGNWEHMFNTPLAANHPVERRECLLAALSNAARQLWRAQFVRSSWDPAARRVSSRTFWDAS